MCSDVSDVSYVSYGYMVYNTHPPPVSYVLMLFGVGGSDRYGRGGDTWRLPSKADTMMSDVIIQRAE
jgi:hypothetical protein